MAQARQPSDRLATLIEARAAPALAEHGFGHRRRSFAASNGEVRWLVEVEVAPWSTPAALSVSLAWGVQVPGLADVLGDGDDRRAPAPWACPVRGRAGGGAGDLDASWHRVQAHPWPVDRLPAVVDVLDARTAAVLVHDATADVLPALAGLASVADVQAHLASRLDRHPRATSTSDLATVRTIFALSILQGERANAERWLDYLEARSVTTMAPDLVAERLTPLRRRCLVAG